MGLEAKAREIVAREVDDARSTGSRLGSGNECFACHVIYAIMNGCNTDEATAADLLSQVLSDDPLLNERFIDALEYVHLYSRARALWFYSKDRISKDDYLSMHVKNAIAELEHELKEYGREAVMRRLILSYISTYIAQVIGLDLHASMEEVYYLLRKNDELEEEMVDLLKK